MGHKQRLSWAFSQLVAQRKRALPESKKRQRLTEAKNPDMTFRSAAQAVQRL